MRNSLIIAFVNSAVYLRLERKTKRVEDVRIAFNRVGGKIPERSKRAEEKLRGQMLSAQAVEDAAFALRSELKLSSDFRVSGEYRTDVASVLFKRALGRSASMLLGEESFV
jgi:CO/xanthine dehydrogenase FAD-binding subunit